MLLHASSGPIQAPQRPHQDRQHPCNRPRTRCSRAALAVAARASNADGAADAWSGRRRAAAAVAAAAAAAGAQAAEAQGPSVHPGLAGQPLVERTYEYNWRTPLAGHDHLDPACRPVLALGKFDALHKGHQALAAAALQLGGRPVLLSFSGMAAVLGWPQRRPLVAPCDRPRVLHLWAQQLAEQLAEQQEQQQQQQRGVKRARREAGQARAAQGQQQQQSPSPGVQQLPQPRAAVVPVRQRYIPFAAVRSLSPEAFVHHIQHDFRAAGVVAGGNYRFGYKAAGDTALLQQLCSQWGLQSAIVQLVGAAEPGAVGPVSSSKIREMLDSCRVEAVRRSLGRPYRLVAEVSLRNCHEQQPPSTHSNSGSSSSSHYSIDRGRGPQQASDSAGAGAPGPVAAPSGSASSSSSSGSSSSSSSSTAGAPTPAAAAPRRDSSRMFVPLSGCLNQPPAPGVYLCSLQLFGGASGRSDLLQLEQALGAADAGARASSSNGTPPGSVQVLHAASRSGGIGGCSWCVRASQQEVEVAPDGLLLPMEVWQAVVEAYLKRSSGGGGCGDGGGSISSISSISSAPPPTRSRDPTCWDTDDNEDDAEEGAQPGGGATANALLALDLESCLLQLCTVP